MLTAILGMAGGITAALIGAWAALRTRRPGEAELEIVDVAIVPDRDDVVLDVKLRNSGGRVAILKRLNLHVLQAGRFIKWGELNALLVPSEQYDIVLPRPEDASSSSVIKNLSQVISTGKADRFLVRLRARTPRDVTFVYRLRLELIYNGDDRRVLSRTLAIACPDLPGVWTSREFSLEVDQDATCPVKTIPQLAPGLQYVERKYPELVNILSSAEILSWGLDTVLARAQAAIHQLPTFRQALYSRCPDRLGVDSRHSWDCDHQCWLRGWPYSVYEQV